MIYAIYSHFYLYIQCIGQGSEKIWRRITLDYVSSIDDDVEIAHYDILGSKAHDIMLYENKIITKNEIKKILKGLESLKKEKFD